ncbi:MULTISPECIES: ABC transporter ATP-binding protein [Arthrobacter]|uniref:ABC transporter ATP-binding protein n=1 Tax=Arthrobacter TaxID=1663 RepID=UPI001404C677|nr:MULTISPECIES: ABC transporter ATP-binding protein [Arthrobacter]MBT8162473.1 ABC transporter ATP-binding protein [Arthrobacter sp. GN70]
MNEPLNSLYFTCRVEELAKDYGKVQAVRNISFDLVPGEVFGLLGPNGSGKSTILHILTGLLDANRGSVEVNGVCIKDKDSRQWIGFAPDDLPLPVSLTAVEYLNLHHRLRKRDDRKVAIRLAEALGLSGALGRSISSYSHGMKRKLQLIAAVMHSPDLLILDEPFRGLDPEASSVLRDLLRIFTGAGGSVLIATHDMLRAELDCDRVMILYNGEQAALGSPSALREAYGGLASLEDVFLQATKLDEFQVRRREQLRAALSFDQHGEELR